MVASVQCKWKGRVPAATHCPTMNSLPQRAAREVLGDLWVVHACGGHEAWVGFEYVKQGQGLHN
jgi:hypothetical protein